MSRQEDTFEVEIRCRFGSYAEACESLPFLDGCLNSGNPYSWHTGFFGLELFKSGYLLRAGQVTKADGARFWLGWKGADVGSFANIRQEIDEDFTVGISTSAILKLLGGRRDLESPGAVVAELERLGHRRFMEFGGNDRSGYDHETGVSIKLMNCPSIRWPFMVELEKSAATLADALRHERELYELSRRLNLEGRLVKEEPPTLLYSALFPE